MPLPTLPLPFAPYQSAPWTPAVLARAVWMTAGPSWCFTDAGGTVPCGDGDLVRVWKDRSANGRNLVQGTSANRPTLTLDVNGRWVVRYDGVNDKIETTAGATWFPSKRGLVAAALKRSGTNVSGVVCGTYSGSLGTVPFFIFYHRDNGNFVWYDGVANITGTPTGSGWKTRRAVRDADTTLKVYTNGTLTDTLTVANNQQAANPLSVGNDRDGSNIIPIDFGELIVTDTVPSAGDQLALETYLNAAWGVY